MSGTSSRFGCCDGLLEVEHAADKGLAIVGRQMANPQVLAGEAVPDGEQEASDELQPRFGVARERLHFGVPQCAPFGFFGLSSVRRRHRHRPGSVARLRESQISTAMRGRIGVRDSARKGLPDRRHSTLRDGGCLAAARYHR